MKSSFVIIALVIVAVSFLVVKNIGADDSKENDLSSVGNLYVADFAIEGMYCDSCAYGVKAQFEEVEGVLSADVNAWQGSGVVFYDKDKVDAETIAAASTVYPAVVVSENPAK